MKKIQFLIVAFCLVLSTNTHAKEINSQVMPGVTFQLPDSYNINPQLQEQELSKVGGLAPEIYNLMQQSGAKYETYNDPNLGEENKNYLMFTAKQIQQKDFYEVKDNQVAQSVCGQMIIMLKQIYKNKQNIKTHKCYKMKFPKNAKWGLYQELDHPEFQNGRAIYMIYIDNNFNEVSVSVTCEAINCNAMRQVMATMIMSLKIN